MAAAFSHLLFLLFACCCSAFLPTGRAAEYIVGGKAGWTTPSRAHLDYTQWSTNISFQVGDTLEFNYVAKAHNVLEVTRSDFRYCNTTNPIASFTDGNTTVVLSKPGNYYFIDGVGDHCSEGQKFQAKVIGNASSTVASAPASQFEPELAPAPEPSSQQVMPRPTATASDSYIPVTMVISTACVATAASKLWL